MILEDEFQEFSFILSMCIFEGVSRFTLVKDSGRVGSLFGANYDQNYHLSSYEAANVSFS